MAGEFFATAALGEAGRRASSIKAVRRSRPARITVSAILSCDGQQGGEFEGDFVALVS
jgi:hypothetical protein